MPTLTKPSVLDDINNAITFVKGLTDTQLGEAHETTNSYVAHQIRFNGGSVSTQEVVEVLGWDYDCAVDVLLDASIDGAYDEIVSANNLEEDEDAQDAIISALKVLHAELYCIQKFYKRVRN